MLRDRFKNKTNLEPIRPNKSKGPISKRQTVSKKKPQEVPKVTDINPFIITKEQAWLSFEIIVEKDLKKDDRNKREQLLLFLFNDIGPVFYLMDRTLEHSLKLIDVYLGKRSLQSQPVFRNSIYPDRQQLLVDFVTAIFMSSKYNEVYPPILLDFINFCQGDESKIIPSRVLSNQIAFFSTLDLNMNVALVSDWWKIYHQEYMPVWAYLCYLDFDLKDKSQFIYEEITRFINALMKSSQRNAYLQFVKESDEKWRVKEGDKNRKKIFDERCQRVYKAFSEFRAKRYLPFIFFNEPIQKRQ